MKLRFASALFVALLGVPAFSQLDMASLYDKQEVMVPMRDGVKLFTSIYTPKDRSARRPILMTRTPYSSGPYGAGAFRGFRDSYVKEGFTFVYQDVRGRYMSEGEFVDMREMDEGDEDGEDGDEDHDACARGLFNLPVSRPDTSGALSGTGRDCRLTQSELDQAAKR